MDINDPQELKGTICNGDVRKEIITCYWSKCGLSLELHDYIQTTALLINLISTTIYAVDDDENGYIMKSFMMMMMLMTLMLMIMVMVMVVNDN